MKDTIYKILSKLPYSLLSVLSQLILKLGGVGRIPTIQEEVKFLGSLIPHIGEFTFIDIGANRGEYSLELLRKFPNVTIYAFEPALNTFNILKNNTYKTKISCINLGIGETSKTVELFYDSLGSGLASLSRRDLSHLQIDFDLSETVSIVTLDSWLKDTHITNGLVVKMDIEGHELFALEGASEALKARIKLIQFEFGGANIDSRTYFIDLWRVLSPNFDIYRLTAKGLKLVKNYSESCEIFLNTTYYARRKIH